MSTEAQAAADGPLSIDQAVGLMTAEPQVEDQISDDAPDGEPEIDAADAEEADAEQDSEADPTADDSQDPDEDPAIDGEEEAESESDPEQPVIAAPKSWDAAERAEFAKLPRAAQEIIAGREVERDKAVSRAQNEANEVRKQAQAELAGIEQFSAKLDQAVTRAQSAFAGKWDGLTPEAWLQFSREDPSAYTIAKAEYDADMAELKNIENAHAEARSVADAAQKREFQNYLQAESVKLADEAPDLLDPVEGPVRKQKLQQFLLSKGFDRDQINGSSAAELGIAYDAMRYREGQAALKKASAAKPAVATKPTTSKPTPRVATPSAAAPVRPSQQRIVDTAKARLQKSGSIEDAVAVLLAKG